MIATDHNIPVQRQYRDCQAGNVVDDSPLVDMLRAVTISTTPQMMARAVLVASRTNRVKSSGVSGPLDVPDDAAGNIQYLHRTP
jgi:hypothetical protein